MNTSYNSLSRDDRIRLCMEFMACGTTIPLCLQVWLKREGLYSLITKPRKNDGKES